jgi:hypothetical protein
MSDHSGQQAVANVRERLAVHKQGLHTFHMERLNLKEVKRGRG